MHFEIPGPPVGKGRPRVVNGHAYTPERTRTHEATIAMLARNALALAGSEIISGPVCVSAWFYLPNHQHEADLDNYIKAVLDGCNGVIYADDRQVVVIHGWKFIDKENPRTEVAISSVIGAE